VIANGDIDSPQKALQVMQYTGADAVMVGRAAQGRPWLCREIDQYIDGGYIIESPDTDEIKGILLEHLNALHAFYGEFMGVKIARKHVGWYLQATNTEETNNPENNSAEFRKHFNQLELAASQCDAIENYFQQILELNTNKKTELHTEQEHTRSGHNHHRGTNEHTINEQGSVTTDRPAIINKEVIAA
jgi:tRNA-dihydrouridine synthase B